MISSLVADRGITLRYGTQVRYDAPSVVGVLALMMEAMLFT
ncbi:hypothetical protein ACMD2_00939 [Ananas comosus]|uniref:Uncharacterized protein n=1 Tax=Ananas comosus TaxID=4615 RepID=A0A199UXP4_ANACO|nr:hypothetical protein ACMD2_00939 [Ananas comosus]